MTVVSLKISLVRAPILIWVVSTRVETSAIAVSNAINCLVAAPKATLTLPMPATPARLLNDDCILAAEATESVSSFFTDTPADFEAFLILDVAGLVSASTFKIRDINLLL